MIDLTLANLDTRLIMNIIATIVSLLLSTLLVILYLKQYKIQTQQKDIMDSQTKLRRERLRSHLQVSNVMVNSESDEKDVIDDYVTLEVKNKGESNITDIHGWLHLEDEIATFDSLSQKLKEDAGFTLTQMGTSPEDLDQVGLGGELGTVVLEPGEKRNLMFRLFQHTENGEAMSLSEILEKAANCENIKDLNLTFYLIYKDATEELQSSRVFGFVSFDLDKPCDFETAFNDGAHGLVLPEDQAVSEFQCLINSSDNDRS